MMELAMAALKTSGLLTGFALSMALTVSGATLASDLPSRKGAPPVPVAPSITWFDIAVSV